MGKTYFIDVDGTIVEYLTWEQLDAMALVNPISTLAAETLLPGVKELWSKITNEDSVVITTARHEKHRALTEKIFEDHSLRYDTILMDLPNGPRILINDTPDILIKKAIAINVERNHGFYFKQSD